MASQKIAILSVYDKTGLLDLAKGLTEQNVRILASGGTSRMLREAGFAVEYAPNSFLFLLYIKRREANMLQTGTLAPSQRPPRC